MRRRLVFLLILCVPAIALLGIGPAAASATIQFNVSFSSSVHATPLDGRVIVIVSPTNDPEPRLQADAGWVVGGPPMWGKDVNGMTPGAKAVVGGAGTYGYPLASFDDLAPGDYCVQALLNVYTTFHRSDGSVVKLHLPAGDGDDLFISPGNLVSTPKLLHLDAALGGTFALKLDQVLPPLEMVPPGGTTQQGNPIDTEHVRHIKIKSALLSRFWGRPMYIGANILLPEGYDDPANRAVYYPVEWWQDHFTTGNAVGFDEGLGDPISQWWVSDSASRFIIVDIRHENPFYDDSYAVNSANLGPYGDAITKELMPAVERSFRIIRARWARYLVGFSTGGWEAAAQMIFYPDLYGGASVFCPDPLAFHRLQLVDIYEDANAYFVGDPASGIAQPGYRDDSGAVVETMEQQNHWALALGTRGRWASGPGTSTKPPSAPRARMATRRRSGTSRAGESITQWPSSGGRWIWPSTCRRSGRPSVPRSRAGCSSTAASPTTSTTTTRRSSSRTARRDLPIRESTSRSDTVLRGCTAGYLSSPRNCGPGWRGTSLVRRLPGPTSAAGTSRKLGLLATRLWREKWAGPAQPAPPLLNSFSWRRRSATLGRVTDGVNREVVEESRSPRTEARHPQGQRASSAIGALPAPWPADPLMPDAERPSRGSAAGPHRAAETDR